MEMTEEQRRRAEANRLAAIQRLGRSTAEAGKREHWTLFWCQKPHSPSLSACTSLAKPQLPAPPPPEDRFLVVLEICAPDAFSVNPEPVAGCPFPGKAECLQRMEDCVSPVIPFRFIESQTSGRASVYMLNDYDLVLKCLKKMSGIQLQVIPWKTLVVVQKFLHSYVSTSWVPCMPNHLSDEEIDKLIEAFPKKLRDSLLPFQLEGVRFGLRRGGRCIIADEMGLGKTIQAIAIAYCFMGEGPVLVICPAVLRFSWAEELEHWLPSCLPTDIHLVFGHHDNLTYLKKLPKVVVISYTMLNRLRKSMLEQEWALIIVDEAHNVRCTKKASEQDETQAVLDMASKVKRIILLSGTPSLSRPGLLGKDKYEFANNYCSVKFARGSQGKIFKDFSGGIRLEELSVLLKQTVMIRRLKEHVLVELPPKRRQVIRLLLKAQDIRSAAMVCQADVSNQNEKGTSEDLLDEGEGGGIGGLTDDNPNSARRLSYQEVGIAKLSGFREWLSNHSVIKEAEGATSLDASLCSQKMIIFAHHLKVLDGVQAFVSEKGIGFIRIDGSTLPRDRQAAVQAFRSSVEVKIAIIGITAGGVGLDFSSARNVVFVELPKTASEMLQAEDRAHRRGQANAVNIYIFCAKDTLDESHWQQLNKSLYRVSSMMNGKQNAMRGIEVDNVCNLSQFINLQTKNNEDGGYCSSKNDEVQVSIVNVQESVYTSDACRPSNVDTDMSTERNRCPSSPSFHSKLERQSLNSEVVGGETCSITSKEVETTIAEPIASVCLFSQTSDEQAIQGHSSEVNLVCEESSNTEKKGSWKAEENDVLFNEVQTSSKILAVNANLKTDKGADEATGMADTDSNYVIKANSLRFEVSQYTGRIHMYACISGIDSRPRPLFQNFRPEELESAVLSTEQHKNAISDCLDENLLDRSILLRFIGEWNSLRPIERNKLYGKPLQLPLELELCYLKENINHGSGGLLKGGSKRRVTPSYDISHPLPENAMWKKISLSNGSKRKEKEYLQAWTINDEPLCKLCQTLCSGKQAKEAEFFEDLFCTLSCFQEYRIRTSQRSLRDALFQIEHGVCTFCKLDCHKLVAYIKPLSVAKRKEHIEKVAPNLANNSKLLGKLINEPTAGNAWHADHIVPVYKGGGECRLENMRTLCVACHYEVTANQRAERRLLRMKAKEQLKAALKGAKEGSVMENVESNSSEGHLSSGVLENSVDDELLIKVPGSAYSRDTTGISDKDAPKDCVGQEQETEGSEER